MGKKRAQHEKESDDVLLVWEPHPNPNRKEQAVKVSVKNV